MRLYTTKTKTSVRSSSLNRSLLNHRDTFFTFSRLYYSSRLTICNKLHSHSLNMAFDSLKWYKTGIFWTPHVSSDERDRNSNEWRYRNISHGFLRAKFGFEFLLPNRWSSFWFFVYIILRGKTRKLLPEWKVCNEFTIRKKKINLVSPFIAHTQMSICFRVFFNDVMQVFKNTCDCAARYSLYLHFFDRTPLHCSVVLLLLLIL